MLNRKAELKPKKRSALRSAREFMKTEQKMDLGLDFLNAPEVLSELSMAEIKGGRSVDGYMGCGEHHDGTEEPERLLALV